MNDTKHTPEQWRWGFFKHRRDLKEACTYGTWTPFWEFRPVSEMDEFETGTVLAVCEYGHVLKIEDHYEQCVLASQGGDGGESDIIVSDEVADIIAAAPWLLAALKGLVYHSDHCHGHARCDEPVAPLFAAAREAIVKAEPKPNITGTPAKDVVRGDQSKEALFYEDPVEGGAE